MVFMENYVNMMVFHRKSIGKYGGFMGIYGKTIGQPQENGGCPWDLIGIALWLCQNSY